MKINTTDNISYVLRTNETNQSINRAAPIPNKTSQRHEYKIHINTVTLSLTGNGFQDNAHQSWLFSHSVKQND